jgi:CheY-like chemotaxis protein/HPt (histidine-containing phosphotransfer) domain-containing protein
VAAGVCATLDQIALLKEVELTLFVDPALPPQILGDPIRLRQIMLNLANNAIKFSSGYGRQAKVTLRITRQINPSSGQEEISFCVSDNGIGMDAETQSRLFTSFTQADASTTRNYGGTGLGLVISRRLANLMGGEISLRSEPDHGAEFTLHLPLQFIPETISPAKISSQLEGVSCLIVGDNLTLAENFFIYLKHEGVAVERVESRVDAQRWIVNRPVGIHVIVYDSGHYGPYSIEGLRECAHARSEVDVRFIVIGRGRRRRCHREVNGDISIDGNILCRGVFLNIVAIAAGKSTDPCFKKNPCSHQNSSVSNPLMTREKARRLGRLILIAEDNEINQKVILQQLMLMGETADMAENGLKALELWRSGNYSVLLTDLHMPQMDGYELTVAIRAAESGKSRIPIIALTANALIGEAEHCIALGMDDYLSKPVQLVNLKAMLMKWLPEVDSAVYEMPLKEVIKAPDISNLVDVNVLKALVGDDDEIIAEFFREFRLTAARDAAEFRAACTAGQSTTAGALMHKLKAPARSIGALTLSKLCAYMENAGNKGDMDMLMTLQPEFERELVNVDNFLDGYLTSMASSHPR